MPNGPLLFPHQGWRGRLIPRTLASARELWADAIKSGKALGADAVVIADEYGGTLFVPMNEALPKRPR